MESTGSFWKPIFNILEGHMEVLVVNVQHLKAVPGRKTDVKDAEWIADLLQHGLLRASFVPPAPQRELRELIRYRTSLVEERSRIINRLQKTLEDANLKLASVASDLMGRSARDMLAARLSGEVDPSVLAQLARGRMRAKRDLLEQALQGLFKTQGAEKGTNYHFVRKGGCWHAFTRPRRNMVKTSGEGVGSPLGWLWQMMTAGQL